MSNFIKFINLLLIIFQLCCCNKQSSNNKTEIDEPLISSFDYENFPNSCIEYDELINLNVNNSYLYFYSTTCGHCNNIKNSVLNFLCNSKNEFFLVEFNENIEICNELYIDFNNFTINDFCIYGTPTLVYIKDFIFDIMLSGSNQILEYINNPQI